MEQEKQFLQQEKQYLKSMSLIYIQSGPDPRLTSAIRLCIDDIPAREIMLEELNYYKQYKTMSEILLKFGKFGSVWGCKQTRGSIERQRKEIEKKFPHLKWGDLNKNFLNCFQDILIKK